MDPIVVAKAVSSHDPSHAVVKIRGVDATGLELRLQSWQDSDAGRLPETAGYLAFERGRHSLGDGIMVEAGSVEVSRQHALVSMNFTAPFRTTPVVLTAVSSALHDKGPSGRPTRITKPGFQFHHPSRAAEEASEGTDVISYIAWVPAAGTIEGLAFEVGRTDRVERHQFSTLAFRQIFSDVPIFLADIQAAWGGNPLNVRWEYKDLAGINAKIEEAPVTDGKGSPSIDLVGFIVFK